MPASVDEPVGEEAARAAAADAGELGDPAELEAAVDAADGEDDDLGRHLLARTRHGGPVGTPRRRRAGDARSRGGNGGRGRADRERWSAAGPDELDPVRVGAVLEGFVAERGWDATIAQARVLADWAAIVGPDVAAHCRPVALTGGELRLAAESTAWATQLRLLRAHLLARIAEQVGPGVVQRLTVTGPVAPSWRHGPRSVQGARGPRDTYG